MGPSTGELGCDAAADGRRMSTVLVDVRKSGCGRGLAPCAPFAAADEKPLELPSPAPPRPAMPPERWSNSNVGLGERGMSCRGTDLSLMGSWAERVAGRRAEGMRPNADERAVLTIDER